MATTTTIATTTTVPLTAPPPVTQPPSTAAPPTLPSTPPSAPSTRKAPAPARTAGRLIIPGIGLDEPVVSGGQAQIDQGHVVFMLGNLLAGHRTSHGAVFHALPGIRTGDELAFNQVVYVVVARQVTYSDSAAQIAGWPLVLQTSWSQGGRLLVFCRPS